MTGIAAKRVAVSADDGFLNEAGQRAMLFAAAARQSRRSRRLRVLLPTIGLLLATLVVAVTVITRISISLSVGDLKITAEGLSMDAPKLSGSDGKGRTYKASAQSATQDLSDTRVIRLTGVEASVTQVDGSYARLTADTGRYDTAAQKLVLDDNIRLSNSDGSSGRLERAEIDLNTGQLSSDSPVAFTSNLGDINAEKMGFEKKAGTVKFTGGVRMTINPAARPGGTAQRLDEAEGNPK